MTQKKGLGKGLNILIPNAQMEKEDAHDNDLILMLPINEIEPNRDQPRKSFDRETLEELADSISKYGVIQPIIVRNNEDYYEIVAGERRWRASRIAGLKEVPVIVKNYDELKALEVALIENLQRENLNGVEEALTYKRLQDEFHLTQDAIAERVGKKRSTIANSLRILNLSKNVQAMLQSGKISSGHAKALLAISDIAVQDSIAEKIVESDLSVRQTEAIMKNLSKKVDKKIDDNQNSPFSADNLIYYRSVERELNNLLGTKVKLSNGKNKGKIEIEYLSDDDLNRLVELLKKLEA